MLYLALKALHVLGAAAFLGTGAGSAWFKFRAWRSGDVAAIAWVDAEVVRADWVFTVPAGLLMPVTGFAMTMLSGVPLSTPWVLGGFLGYALAGVCWLPAAYLQLEMKALSAKAKAEGTPLPPAWHSAQRTWALLGLPSFLSTLVVVWLMVTKGLVTL